MTHIALTAYDLENGGISRVAVYLANGFADAGHRVTLLLCTSAGERDADLKAMLRPGVSYAALSHRRYASRALGQIMCVPSLRRWLRRERPDIVLGTANNIAWFSGWGLRANRAASSALYIKTTNPVIREKDGAFVTALRRWGYRRLFARSASVLTLSDAESRILEKEFPRNTGVFQSVFNPYLTGVMLSQGGSRDAVVNNGDAPKMLAVGRLSPQKNMTRLIEAFATAKEIDLARGGTLMASARLTIAGEGPELGMLEADAARRGLSEQIVFAGFCTDIAGMLRDADLFVLSSNYEGLPAVVLEALGSGCPVVTTDCFPAARELLSDLPGCGVTQRSARALAGGILQAAEARHDGVLLQARAADYSIDSAVRSHLTAMAIQAS